MVEPYAGSRYIGTDPYRSGVRPGVEYEEDDEMNRWAEEKGKLRKRGGATTFKIPDGKGGFTYTLRNAEQYSGPGGEGTQVGLDVDGKTVLAEAMGKTPVHKARLTKAQAQSFKGEYQNWRDKEAATLAETQKLAKEKEMAAEKVRLENEAADAAEKRRQAAAEFDRSLAARMPLPGERLQGAQADVAVKQVSGVGSSIDREEKRRQQREQAVANVALLPGFDVEGISKRGEDAMRAANAANKSPEEAWAAAEKAHAEDAAEIKRLEESNIPVAVRKAKAMRIADPDLAKLPDYTRIRDINAEQREVRKGLSSFIDKFDTSSRAGFGQTAWDYLIGSPLRKYKEVSDFDENDKKKMRSDIESVVEDVRALAPFYVDDRAGMGAQVRNMIDATEWPDDLKELVLNKILDAI